MGLSEEDVDLWITRPNGDDTIFKFLPRLKCVSIFSFFSHFFCFSELSIFQTL